MIVYLAMLNGTAGSVAEEKHKELFDVLGQMADAHIAEPHWYLPWLAVRPDRQGDGLGGRLLAHCLGIVDGSGLPATTRSASCPPLTSMLRPGGGAASRR